MAQGLGQRLAEAVADQLPGVAHDPVESLGAQYAREFLGGGVDALHGAFGLAAQGLFHGLHLGVDQRQLAPEERRAPEDEVFAPRFDPFLDPLDALEPHQFGRARGVGDEDREAALAPCSGIGRAGHAGPELHQRNLLGDFADAVGLGAVDVAERIVAQQVAHGADAELPFEEFGPRFAYARHEFHFVVQNALHTAKVTDKSRSAIRRRRFFRCGGAPEGAVPALRVHCVS